MVVNHRPQKIPKNNENTKYFNDPQARKETNKTAETNKESYWLLTTCAIVGDDMVNEIDEKKSQKHGNVKVF